MFQCPTSGTYIRTKLRAEVRPPEVRTINCPSCHADHVFDGSDGLPFEDESLSSVVSTDGISARKALPPRITSGIIEGLVTTLEDDPDPGFRLSLYGTDFDPRAYAADDRAPMLRRQLAQGPAKAIVDMASDLLGAPEYAELVDAASQALVSAASSGPDRVALANQALGKLEVAAVTLSEVRTHLLSLQDTDPDRSHDQDIALLDVVVIPTLADVREALEALAGTADADEVRDAALRLRADAGFLQRVLSKGTNPRLLQAVSTVVGIVNLLSTQL